MNDLYKLIKQFEEDFSHQENIIELKKSYKNIEDDKELMAKIEKYNKIKDEKLRYEILTDEKVKTFKHLEVNLNYQILEINQKLSEITDKRSCL